ncbi:hypothetical protein C3K47_03790 [Solitalea longa]|uniref:Uncharacterized protein n=1 Tax=Solitalea longa TaxID=2079460 RepID=A0A2S5A8E5_9SPHI|nr:hypothetical protein [Solitalea longa]POY38527.1 hypothetical protein C3K47_03790 [Solitalea longa]
MKNVIALLFYLSILSTASFAQLKPVKINATKIPAYIKYKGKFIEGIEWTDKSGKNTLLLTETGEQWKTNDDYNYREQYLYAYHYLTTDSLKLDWKIQDYVKECEVDVLANFVKNSTSITDLNNDGVAEIWLIYRVACRGDVSPSTMKIIMHEGSKKYIVRGESKVKYSQTDYAGDKMVFDVSFNNAPESFKTYATQLWNKYVLEKFE